MDLVSSKKLSVLRIKAIKQSNNYLYLSRKSKPIDMDKPPEATGVAIALKLSYTQKLSWYFLQTYVSEEDFS